MTWSVSFGAASKADAKLVAVDALAKALLSQQAHRRDFAAVCSAINGAIDVCAEGSVSVSASGHLSGSWENGDIPVVTGVNIQLNVYSTPPVKDPQQPLL